MQRFIYLKLLKLCPYLLTLFIDIVAALKFSVVIITNFLSNIFSDRMYT